MMNQRHSGGRAAFSCSNAALWRSRNDSYTAPSRPIVRENALRTEILRIYSNDCVTRCSCFPFTNRPRACRICASLSGSA